MVGEYLGWRAMYGIAHAAAVTVALGLTLKELRCRRSQPEDLGVIIHRAAAVNRRAASRRAGAAAVVPVRGDGFWGVQYFLDDAGVPPRRSSLPIRQRPHRAVRAGGRRRGVLAAPVAGRLADCRSARWTIGAGLTCILLAYIVLYVFGGTVAGMVAEVILLDLGAQSAHISNQSRIYSIRPEARSRMNTAYPCSHLFRGRCCGLLGRRVGLGSRWLGWGLPRGPGNDRGGTACLRRHIGEATESRRS